MKQLNRDRVYFLMKDPHWTFIWWEVTQETLNRTQVQIGGDNGAQARLTLRIHDVSDIIFDGTNSHGFFDVEVVGHTDHWYLNVPVSNRNYCVEVGLKANGQFYPMVKSNTLCLPREGVSDSTEERWSTIDI